MAYTPVSGWNRAGLVAQEASFGTTPNPAAAQALELVNLDLGPNEVGVIRSKQDRGVGRGMQDGWVEGRVQPIPFNLETSCKSRSGVAAAAAEEILYAAGGLYKTTNSGTSVVFSLTDSPETDSAFQSASIYGIRGKNAGANYAEQLRGCIAKTLTWEGGDKELRLKVAGEGIGKYTLGHAASITLADGSTTSLTLTAEESKRIGKGWYQCESEIIYVTENLLGATTRTITRGALSSTGAAHSGKLLRPYHPALSYTGSPVSEVVSSVVIGGVTIRCTKFSIALTTGMEMLPGETGSKYVQGTKTLRYSIAPTVELALKGEDVALFGKATTRENVALSIVQGGTAGGIWTFAMPYCEVMPFVPPEPENDIVLVTVPLRVRDSATGNDAFTLTQT